MDKQKTLEWLAEVSREAVQEARNGNTIPANRMGGNPALAHYLNNVEGAKTVSAEDWAHWYPNYLAEADTLREASEKAVEVEQQGDRIDSLEAKFEKMMGMVEQLVEAQQEPEAEELEESEVEQEAETEAADESPADDDTETDDADAGDDEPAEETEEDSEAE